MKPLIAKTVLWALGVGLIFGAGVELGWILWHPQAPKTETYAPEVRQKDGSLVLERKPQADAKPAQELPKGAVLERVVEVTVQPRASAEATAPTSGSNLGADGILSPATPCPPVRVNLSLVRMPDQSRRVVASSPDGAVVGGVDIPVEAAAPAPKTLKWAAGGLYNPTDRTYGAFLDRDLGPIRAGAEVYQVRTALGQITWAGQLRLGLRF